MRAAETVQQYVKDSQQAGVHGIPIFFLDRTNPVALDTLHAMLMMSGARAFVAFNRNFGALFRSTRTSRPRRVPVPTHSVRRCLIQR